MREASILISTKTASGIPVTDWSSSNSLAECEHWPDQSQHPAGRGFHHSSQVLEDESVDPGGFRCSRLSDFTC